MKLDRSKKYKFGGDVYERSHYWRMAPGKTPAWSDKEFQHFADRGLVEEVRELVRETKTVRVEGCVAFIHRDCGLAIEAQGRPNLPAGARSKPFTAEFEVEVDA